MIDSIKIKNFTVFKNAEFEFSPGLNVIIGENGAGKSHLLKLAYSLSWLLFDEHDRLEKGLERVQLSPTLYDRLLNTFLAEKLENLIRRGNEKKAEVSVVCGKRILNYVIEHDRQELGGTFSKEPMKYPVFLPPKEVLAIYYGFTALYDKREVSFDVTFNDLCHSVGLPFLREKYLKEVQPLISELENIIGGQIVIENNRVYLKPFNQPKMEINMVAEGWRKIGLLSLLLKNGAIQPGCSLFWDEPEANLNPELAAIIAKTIVMVAKQGVQIFLATHSLFLMRELEIAMSEKGFQEKRFFGLYRKNQETTVMQGASIDDLGEIRSLEEELKQSDRYLNLEP